MKNLFKEIAYLGLGTAALAKHKTEELLEKLVTNNKLTRDDGERIIADLKIRMQKAKQNTDDQVEDFVNRFAEKTGLAKNEVRESIQHMLEKPKKAKKDLIDKTHALTDKIVERSTMSRDKADEVLHNFLDEVLLIKLKAKKKAKKLSRKINQMSNQGKAIADDLETKSEALLKEVKPRMQKSMDKVIDSLHLANDEDVQLLEKSINKLEKKKISK